jgi:hypothetical protein
MCTRSHSGAGSRSGLRARESRAGVDSFSGGLDFGNGGISLLLLADNYNHTTNDFTTETQSAQRTHRDF